MTELTITPKVSDKTARFKGTVAAGEHVAVTIKGGAEWLGEDDGANLTLRVLDLVTGRTLAVFPRPQETMEEDETPDAWSEATEDANDLYCELNLNTARMVAAARHMLRVPVLFVLGDTDDPRTLYFRDRYEIEYWPERIGDTTPYDLDKWPKKIDDWTELVSDWTARLNGMKLSATRESSPASGNPYVEITLNDGTAESDTKVKVYDGEVSTSAMNSAISAMGATKADKTTTVNGHALSSNVTITKADVGLGNVANTGDSATPVSGGTTKFTTGGAYTELAKKADKVGNATAGNFAGLDQYGNLTDSGKKASDFATAADKANLQQAIETEVSARTDSCSALDSRITTLAGDDPSKSARTIAAEEVAKVVASAPTSFDTLKEIADWIQNDTTGAAKMANDIEDLKSEKADAADLAAVATSGSYNDLTDKPTIPAPVDISGKLDGEAAYPAWMMNPLAPYQGGAIVSHLGRIWQLLDQYAGTDSEPGTSEEWDDVLLQDLIDLKQDALTSAQIGYINAVPSKADKAVPSATGNLAALNAQGDIEDSGVKPSDFATPSDLPYAMVTPGEWQFSDGESYIMLGPAEDPGGWYYSISTQSTFYYSQYFSTNADALASLSLAFTSDGVSTAFTATRPSLPGHLLDRAGNLVVVTGDTTLTLPAAVPGYCRDFLVRLEISGSTVPTITFQGQGSEAPNGADEIAYETDGDEFPVPDEAGDWLYSFTETVAHTFAVSLKKVNAVTQGGA